MSERQSAAGTCLCGAVRFLIYLPVKFCVHCHCQSCRVMTGAAFVTWIGVPHQSFRLAGKGHLRWYICSEQAKRGFCHVCGTPLIFISTVWPDDVHVTRASIIGKVDIVPRFHIHFEQHVDWFEFEDSVPRLGGRSGREPL
jgi:hypothetical protein